MALPLAFLFRNVRERWTVATLAVIGIGLVVAVFVVVVTFLPILLAHRLSARDHD